MCVVNPTFRVYFLCIVRCVSFDRIAAAASEAVRKQVQKAQQDLKAASEAVPPVYVLDWNEIGVPSVDEVHPAAEEPELNWDEPLLFKKFPCIETFKSCPKGQMLLGSFGGTFRKGDSYTNTSWYQKPSVKKHCQR